MRNALSPCLSLAPSAEVAAWRVKPQSAQRCLVHVGHLARCLEALMATEAWHSLTENIKPKAVFRLCLIQTEAKFTFGVLGGISGRWAHLGAILGLSGASRGPS